MSFKTNLFIITLLVGGMILVAYMLFKPEVPTTKGTSLPVSTFPPPIFLPESSSENRSALLIGNSDYADASYLTNPVNDAKALAKVLRKLDFEVIHENNLARKGMKNAIRQFSRQLAKKQGVGLFYYSGHGLQYQGKNYLIPIGAQASLKAVFDLPEETVTVDYVLNAMKTAANQTNLLILDACRNPPNFVKSWFKGEMIPPGVASQPKVSGSLIAYAAAPGEVALSGEGQANSPYVASLMKWMQVPNLSITDALTQVRMEVIKGSHQMQQPEYSSALNAPFYFRVEQPQSEPEPEPHFVAGKVFRDNLREGGLGPEMVWIPEGTFRMGDIQGGGYSDEKPVHTVSVKRFGMGRYEVTVGEFRQFVKATGYKTEAEKGDGCYVYDGDSWGKKKDANWRNAYFSQKDNQPVVCVSWNDAQAYVQWLSQQTGHQYRLPTEAEWEYAARAGTETKYWWGNDIGKNRANCDGCGSQWDNKQTAPVGSFAPNQFGLYDTVGNVWEWIADPWHNNYNNAPSDGSIWEEKPDKNAQLLRGGSWYYVPINCRAANRNRNSSVSRSFDVGFRVVVVAVDFLAL